MIRIGCCVLILAALACDAQEPPSNTGYTGTWERGHETRSLLAIVERNGEYLIRKRVISPKGGPNLRCDWNGNCEEFVDGEKTADYTFRTWVDPKTERLRIECHATITEPRVVELHYLDEFLLKDNGLRLRARTLERGGRTYTSGKPKRDYRKISDSVSDPPPGASTEPG